MRTEYVISSNVKYSNFLKGKIGPSIPLNGMVQRLPLRWAQNPVSLDTLLITKGTSLFSGSITQPENQVFPEFQLLLTLDTALLALVLLDSFPITVNMKSTLQ